MSIATVIERIVGKQRERQAARAADFRDIVVKIADGKEPDAEFVAQVLQEAGKSLDDLQQAVELLQKRRELRKKLDGIPILTAARREIEQRIATANSDLEEAEKRHEEVTVPLQADLTDLKEQIWAGEQARGELWRTCSDADVLAWLADVTAKLQAARAEADQMRSAIREYRTWAENDRQRAAGAFEDDAQHRVERAKIREARAARIEKDLPAVEKTIAALERDEAKIREQMLVP